MTATTFEELPDGEALAGASLASARSWGPDEMSAISHTGEPGWSTLDVTSINTTAVTRNPERYRQAWRKHTERFSWATHRVMVEDDAPSRETVELARRLRDAPSIGSIMLVDRDLADESRWRWPLQVSWVADTVGADLVRYLVTEDHRSWMDDLVEFRPLDSVDLGTVLDIVFLASVADAEALLHSRGLRVNALVLVGDELDDGFFRRAGQLAEWAGAAALLLPHVAGGRALARWFERLVEELSHKNPIDVAMGKSTGSGIVIGGTAAFDAPLGNVIDQMRVSYERNVRSSDRRTRGPRPPVRDTTALPDILAPDVPSERFDRESYGARIVRDMRLDNELGIDLLPEPNARRMLQAAIFRDEPEAVKHAFAAGRRHTVHIWIGDGSTGFLRAETPAGDPALIDREHLVNVTEADILLWADDIPMMNRTVKVGAGQLSETAGFDIDVPERSKDLTLNVALVIGGRVIQSGVIKGAVTPNGGRPRRTDAVHIRFVVGPELVDLAKLIDHGIAADDRVMILEHDVGVNHLFRRELGTMEIVGLADHFAQALAKLVAAQSDAASATWLKSSKGARTFTDIAGCGFDAFQALIGSMALDDNKRFQGIINAPSVHLALFDRVDSRLMIELVYDRDAPAGKAAWCDDFDQALATGNCGSCQPYDPTRIVPDQVPVCPAGFWGIRKEIERINQQRDDDGFPAVIHNRVHDPDEGIGGLDRLLIGVSDRVDKAKVGRRKPTSVMNERISAVVPHLAPAVREWTDWRAGVGNSHSPPQVLILLTHTEGTDLELGQADLLSRRNVRTPFVRQPFATDPPGPILLVLGCSTASNQTELNSFVDAFIAHGASVVIGTVGATLGRFAAPIAGEIAALLASPDGPKTVGEAVLSARRTSMAEGWVTGLLVTTYSDGTYALEH
jgi:hypothetical protein